MFGPIEVELNSGGRRGPSELGGIKPRQLLEILLCARGRRVSKEALASYLWPARLAQDPEATIETYVSLLRRGLADPAAIVTADRGYRVDPGRLGTDLDEFDRLVATGTFEDHRAALGLSSRGEILQHDPFSPWALEAQAHYDVAIGQAAGRAGALALEGGRPAPAVRYLEAAIRRDPEGEHHYVRLMLANYLMGDRAQALRVYHRLLRVCSESGLDPMPETRELHRRMVRGDTVAGEPRPGRRVLIVEDDPRFQSALVQCTVAAGCMAELLIDFGDFAQRTLHSSYAVVVASHPPPGELVLGCPLVLVSKPFSHQSVIALIRGAVGLEDPAELLSG